VGLDSGFSWSCLSNLLHQVGLETKTEEIKNTKHEKEADISKKRCITMEEAA